MASTHLLYALSFAALMCLAGQAQALTVDEINRLTPNLTLGASELKLFDLGLTGGIPPELGDFTFLTEIDLSGNNLTGEIPRALGNLVKLTSLILADNQLTGFGNPVTVESRTGAPPFPDLSGLQNLVYCNLSVNLLGGGIPSSIGAWSSLESLDMSDNLLTGGIPLGFGNLRNLVYLNLRENQLSGPVIPQLGGLPNLRFLYLAGNSLTGALPVEIGQLSRLSGLLLQRNKLSGPIPADLGRLSLLQVLSLANNRFIGPIPPGLGNLTSLVGLDLSNNLLTGTIPTGVAALPGVSTLSLAGNLLEGPIPASIGSALQLQRLNLSLNALSGTIPGALGGLPALKRLDLRSNKLTGGIPLELSNLKSLEWLLLGNNSLSGHLPAGFNRLTSLRFLVVPNNKLSGPIPADLGGSPSRLLDLELQTNRFTGFIPPPENFPELVLLYLDKNQLTGPIPRALGSLSSLKGLDLSENQLSGPIPREFGNLRNLTSCFLGYSGLSGPLPPELANMTSLQSLLLWGNRFSGPFPAGLGTLTKLEYLFLQGNRLTGPLPVALCEAAALRALAATGNRLNGSIPQCLGDLPELRYLSLDSNLFSGVIPPGLASQGKLISLSLLNNNLEGPMPAAFGGLVNLTVLNLSQNRLSGAIPPSLANSPNLSNLLLHNNNLTAGILPELGDLTSLARLSLRNNHLTGPIPSRLSKLTQLKFLTLDNNSLESFLPPEMEAIPNLAYVEVSSDPSRPGKADLSKVSPGCQFLRLTGGAVSDIRFWPACFSGKGCVLDLTGSGSKLSRASRKEVCLGKIAVIVSGYAPQYVTLRATTPLSRQKRSIADTTEPDLLPVLNEFEVEGQDYFLVNGAPVYLNDTGFPDKLDFGPESAAYVGVGYTNVRQRNLCRNANAKLVVAVTWATFGTLFVILVIGLTLWRSWGADKQFPKPPKERAGCRASMATYSQDLAAILTTCFMPVHVGLNILVLTDVWGAWPMWVLLPCIVGPFLISGLLISVAWTRGSRFSGGLGFAFKWPPQPASAPARDRADTLGIGRLAYAVLLWPFGVIATVAFDLLALVGRLGGHLTVRGVPLSIRDYQEARGLLQIAVETLPQSVFQSALYILGSSRATKIYVDDITFISSITISLAGILVNVGLLLKEAFESEEGVTHFWTLVKGRFDGLESLAKLEAGNGVSQNELEVGEAGKSVELGGSRQYSYGRVK